MSTPAEGKTSKEKKKKRVGKGGGEPAGTRSARRQTRNERKVKGM